MPDPPTLDLTDRFGRRHTSLRLSVTDRCNIRCFYCMPDRNAVFAPRETLLTFEEMTRLVSLLSRRAGIREVRLTGGEPLVRRDLPSLVAMLDELETIDDLALTTNGILLADQAWALKQAGLQRINISIDTLDEATFKKISRREGLDKTIAGIDAAIDAGFESVKLNALAIAGISEPEVTRLVSFAIDRGVTIRFIEFMPLDADKAWCRGDVLSGDRLIELLSDHFGGLDPVGRNDPHQPAEEFEIRGGHPVGIIRSVTRPFCEACNRIRLTAEGSIRNCLFAQNETPLRDAMRSGCDDDTLLDRIRQSVLDKAAAHGMDDADFSPPDRPMYSIGG